MSEEIDSQEISSAGQQSQQQHSVTKKNKKVNAKNKTKLIINISDCQYPVVSRVAKKLGWKRQSSADATDWDVFWTDNAVQPQVLLKMQPFQKINHFPGMFNLARKNLMGRYLMKMRKKFPMDYAFFPLTWMLPVEYHQLKSYFQTKQKGKARTFIVKPEALSQGKGIFLTRKLQQIDQNAHCVVQRYMHRPYLIEGLKFDMRVYVLVASVDPLRLYIYYEGLTRFATEKYEAPTKDNMQDVCMHLTNYAINKDNPKFVFNSSSTDMSKGHKRSLTWLLEYLQKNQAKGAKLKQQIEDMIVKTMISGLPVIANTYRSCQPENYASNMCFQLLGFDVMLTDKCEPVLLEINHTPSFTTDTPLDDVIKANYIRDSLILMNINQKTKQNIIKDRKQACQQRVITGKKVKLSNEEKDIQRRKAHAEREKYESKNLGGFKKIYPLDNQQKMAKYQQFLNYSNQTYLISTGTKKGQIASKRTQKIQSAFGTCFKPKQPAKLNTTSKNRETAPQIKISVQQKKYNTKKTINQGLIQSEKKKLIHSDNLISPKSLGQPELYYEIKLAKGFSAGNEDVESPDDILEQKKQYQTTKAFPSSKNHNFEAKSSEGNFSFENNAQKSLNGSSNYLGQPGQIIQQQTQQSSLSAFYSKGAASTSGIKGEQTKGSKKSYSNTRKESAPKQRQIAPKNLNNVEIFFDSQCYPSNNTKKNMQILSATNNENAGRKTQHLKLGIFGINQITSDKDGKKFKTPVTSASNPKSVPNIQTFQTRTKDRHLSNRQKIPILLNTLLIGSSEGAKPAVSANNLRKILTNNVSK